MIMNFALCPMSWEIWGGFLEIHKSRSHEQDSLKNLNVKVTKLAQGLPVGGEIESLDDGTLFSAFKNRSKLNSNFD